MKNLKPSAPSIMKSMPKTLVNFNPALDLLSPTGLGAPSENTNFNALQLSVKSLRKEEKKFSF